MGEPTDRQPLLQNLVTRPHETSKSKNTSGQIGPLDISSSTRHGILAGIWAASFLSVGSISLCVYYTHKIGDCNLYDMSEDFKQCVQVLFSEAFHLLTYRLRTQQH